MESHLAAIARWQQREWLASDEATIDLVCEVIQRGNSIGWQEQTINCLVLKYIKMRAQRRAEDKAKDTALGSVKKLFE